MAVSQVLTVAPATLADFCRQYHIRRLSLFGSVLRQDFGPDSDLDVLVEFEPAHIPGLIGLGTVELELAKLLDQRRLDLHTPGSLNKSFRQQVLAEAEVLFDSQQG